LVATGTLFTELTTMLTATAVEVASAVSAP